MRALFLSVALTILPVVALAHPKSLTARAGEATSLYKRALAAVPAARDALEDALNDYPSARFRDVHARIVRSMYADDEGQSDKVPWTHRGGSVLVLCGEVNAKNSMGGYTGWQQFVFEPAQTDIVPWYDGNLHDPNAPLKRTLTKLNLAREDKLSLRGGDYDEWINAACNSTGDGEQTDAADLSNKIGHPGSK